MLFLCKYAHCAVMRSRTVASWSFSKHTQAADECFNILCRSSEGNCYCSRSHVVAPRPFCTGGVSLRLHSINVVVTAGPCTKIHQRPLLHLCQLPIMDHNDCIRNAQRNRISLIKQRVINGCYKFFPQHRLNNSTLFVCVYVCVCDGLHYTCPTDQSPGPPRHSPSLRHKANWWDGLLLNGMDKPQSGVTSSQYRKLLLSLYIHECVCVCVCMDERSSETVLLAENVMNFLPISGVNPRRPPADVWMYI